MAEKRKTVCVNFFAGPGTGKSTVSSRVFSDLKTAGVNCELVTEFAKMMVWEGNTTALGNQFYITAHQQYHMKMVAEHVDLIVTDSPLILGCIYGGDALLNPLIYREFESFDNINIVLSRIKPYNPIGRMQTASQAVELDSVITNMLDTRGYPYHTVAGTVDSAGMILGIIRYMAPWLLPEH